MSVQTYTRQDCPVAHTLSVVGDQWTLLIIRDVLGGPKRFDELQNGLGISRNLLAQRLKRMVEADLLARRPIPDSRRFTYSLTPKALELRPAILALAEWGQKWRQPEAGTQVEITEKDTGEAVGLRYCRLSDGQEVKSDAIRVRRIRVDETG